MSSRLPFTFQAIGGVGKLALAELPVGPVVVDRLERRVADLGTDPGVTRPSGSSAGAPGCAGCRYG